MKRKREGEREGERGGNLEVEEGEVLVGRTKGRGHLEEIFLLGGREGKEKGRGGWFVN